MPDDLCVRLVSTMLYSIRKSTRCMRVPVSSATIWDHMRMQARTWAMACNSSIKICMQMFTHMQ